MLEADPNYSEAHGVIIKREYPLGAVVAIAELTACHRMDVELIAKVADTEIIYGDWSPGRYAWELKNIRPLPKPFAIRGQQGLWKIDDSILDQVKGVKAL